MNKGQIHLKSNIFRVYQTCDVVLLQHNNITLLHQLVWDLLLVQGTSPKYVYLQNRSNLIWFWGISGSRPNWCIFHIYAIKYIQFSALWGRPATTLFGLEWLKSKQLANVIMRSISTKIQPLFCITPKMFVLFLTLAWAWSNIKRKEPWCYQLRNIFKVRSNLSLWRILCITSCIFTLIIKILRSLAWSCAVTPHSKHSSGASDQNKHTYLAFTALASKLL